ncbi:MAG: SpoIIE family protein phosphatase [Acidimicrobiia bacterium]
MTRTDPTAVTNDARAQSRVAWAVGSPPGDGPLTRLDRAPRNGENPNHGWAGHRWIWPESPVGSAALFLLTLVCYGLGSRIALDTIEATGLASVFFIPAGITVAFLLRTHPRVWVYILLAAGLAEGTMDLLDGYSVLATAGFVAANVIEPVIGATIVLKSCGVPDLARLRHVWWFFTGAVLTAPGVGAAIGALPASLDGDADFLNSFVQWWLGDALGVLLVGCGILVWNSSRDRRSLVTPWGLVLVGGTLLLTLGIFRLSELPLLFLVLVGVTVAGAQFGSRAVATTAVIVAAAIALEAVTSPDSLVPNLEPATALLVVKLQLGIFTMAGLVVAAEAFESARASGEAERAHMEIRLSESERKMERFIASRLQQAFLPTEPDQHPAVSVAARYLPGNNDLEIGGDWYEVLELSEHHIGIIVGDVAGHGLEAAVSMGKLRTASAALALQGARPRELLEYLDVFAAKKAATEFATLAFAILDTTTGELRYASAGHPPLLKISPDGTSEWLTGGKRIPIHGRPSGPGTEATTTLEPGTLLVAYTDGLVERRDEDVYRGLDRLLTAATALRSSQPSEICEGLVVEMGVASSRNDDVVVVVLRYQPLA